MMTQSIGRLSALLVIVGCLLAARAGEVAIYTGTTQWIAKNLADEQAQICVDKLAAAGINNIWYQSDVEMLDLAEWMAGATGNGEVDVCVLYGDVPPDIYPEFNTMPDGSILEMFVESTDGDAVINHADYMFWGLNARNQVGGLENIMDLPGIVMWDDNTPVVVTGEGKVIAPSLTDFQSDRPFHLDQLAGEWFAETILAQNAAGTRADPVIVRDGDRGRLIPVYQTADQVDPKGAVAAEIITWLFGKTLGPTKLALSGFPVAIAGKASKFTVSLLDVTGTERPTATAVAVSLASDSATGAFDTQAGGPFNGTVTSITVPAGESSATFFYRDTAGKDVLLTSTAAGLETGSLALKVLAEVAVENGEVMIYTGTTQWISKALADVEAQICANKLDIGGVTNTWLQSDVDMVTLAEWMQGATGDGRRDVCVLYGDVPPEIYPQGNVMPDDSILELFVESTDGDAVINHADYMFWGLNARNSEGGLRNIMDLPDIVMWDDNTPVVVTAEGKAIAPSLTDFQSDRPFHLDQLAGDWFPEVILAQNAAGTRADPVIVRDGNRGRLIPVFQTADQNDPKGAVAAEIIFSLYGKSFAAPVQLGLRALRSGTPAGKVIGLTVELQDATGSPRAAGGAVTVSLQKDKPTGAFDTQADGPFNGTVTSVTIPAGETAFSFFYKDTAEGKARITASAGGLTPASVEVNVFVVSTSPPGEVVIYTGVTQWIAKALADEQAQICVDSLAAEGIDATWFMSEIETLDLADWMMGATNNGQLDVCVLYGDVPPDIYPQGNAMPDDSILELFVESTDGDAVINHADYMFWGLNGRNQVGGLENIMDIPGIVMWDDNTPVVVTQQGSEIAPSLADFQSDRPFHLDQLAGDWFDEVVLAQNAAGTRADPVIVRDGPRGRLIPVYQTADQMDPKGQVAAEIITWLLSQGGVPSPAVPTGLAATPGDGQVALDWNDNGEPDLLGYNLYRSSAGGPFNKVNGAPFAASSLIDAGLGNGIQYCYKVSAVNPGGESAQTAPACATPGVIGPTFKRGDSDSSGFIDLSDAVKLLNYLFLGQQKPECLDAADVDDSGDADISDAISNLNYQFLGGPPPAGPGPATCGLDPIGGPPDSLGCDRGC